MFNFPQILDFKKNVGPESLMAATDKRQLDQF